MSEKKDKFYITTPIYYVNWVPHIGHFYSSVIVDTIARFNKISWKETRFTTGVDENSQKALIVAEEKKMDIMDYLDEMAWKHKWVWDSLNIDYTDFIRTTEKRHHEVVRDVLQKTFDKWDIYEWEYEWMYCVWCEAFKKEDDLIPLSRHDDTKVCPDHLKAPDKIKEKNYFFKLKKYETWLKWFYKANREFVVPRDRFNEVIAFVDRWLEDFSISRETNTFWIKLPFDEEQVTYVWFDALYNYYTSCKKSRWWDKNNEKSTDESEFFPANLHVVWKDIIRFHAIFWPAMLASYFDLWEEKDWELHFKESDLEKLPKNILTTGFFTVDWQKMSKSLWNVIDPVQYSKEYSKDVLTLYLLSCFNIWYDGDFDNKQALLTYNAKLANNLWNLVNRVVVLSLKLWWILEDDRNPEFFDNTSFWTSEWVYTWNPVLNLTEFNKVFLEKIFDYNLKSALDNCFGYLDNLNKFTDEKEPWKLLKTDPEEAKKVLYTIAEWLRIVWLNLYSFFPKKMWEMFKKFWLENYTEELEKWKLEELKNRKEIFNIKEKWENLFNRFEIE